MCVCVCPSNQKNWRKTGQALKNKLANADRQKERERKREESEWVSINADREEGSLSNKWAERRIFNKPFGHFKGQSQGETADLITQKPSNTSGIFPLLYTVGCNKHSALEKVEVKVKVRLRGMQSSFQVWPCLSSAHSDYWQTVHHHLALSLHQQRPRLCSFATNTLNAH